jgi:hemolysin activation/secretion protein
LNNFVRISLLLTVWSAGSAASALAQETRAAVIAQQQADKATRLRPYEPSKAERITNRLTRNLLTLPAGWYPAVGSVYSGGGFTVGVGYRRYYGDRATWDATGLYSIKNYKLAQLSTVSPGHANGHLDWYGRTLWRDATRVNFFGLGADSLKENRTTFRLREATVLGGARMRATDWTVFNSAVGLEDYTTTDSPGLARDVTFVHSTASAGIDWRPAAGYARRGGLYEVQYHNYADQGGAFDFERVDAEVVQHVPILRENWVLSFHGRLQTTLDGGSVPFFLLPSLGSGSTLRGYASWRFRDRHSELFSGEFRWIPNRLGFDMALFYDTGKVANERRDLNLKGLSSDIGVGARFHGPGATPLRIDVAHGSEGLHIVFSGGPSF